MLSFMNTYLIELLQGLIVAILLVGGVVMAYINREDC